MPVDLPFDFIEGSRIGANAILYGAAVDIAIADSRRRILAANSAMEQITGRSKSELLAGQFPLATHPQDAAVDWSLYQELIAGQRESYRIVKRYVHSNGKMVWGHLTVQPLPDKTSAPKYIIGTIVDITAYIQVAAGCAGVIETLLQLQSTLSNNPDKVRSFYSTHGGNIVYKVLGNVMFNYARDHVGVVYTTPVSNEILAQIDRVTFTPCLFQEYVPKRLEIRATMVGDVMLTVEIHSQETESTKHDWRHYDANTPYKSHTLPRDIEMKCLNIVHGLGLEFGAIDLILQPDGKYVFLEVNPVGQWGWLEELTGLPFAATIAELLICGRNSPDDQPVPPATQTLEGQASPWRDSVCNFDNESCS